MPTIPASQARARFTQMLIAVYRENPRPTSFLRSFFKTKVTGERYLSIEVMRGTEKIAVDVLRGSGGNRNTFSRSTLKVIDPPYYREYFDATELDIYDRMFGVDVIDDAIFSRFLEAIAEKMQILVAKIQRSYELQCAQVLETGIVTVADGSNIDFKRKAASLVDGSATTWATGSNSPYLALDAGAAFLRGPGRAQGGVFNVILGSLAADALLTNATVLARGPLSNVNFDSLRAPQRDAVGANLIGSISSTSYKYNLFTYPEYYDDAAGVQQPYIHPKKIIMLPENPEFIMGFAAVPQLIDMENPRVIKGEFVFGDYRDPKKHTHEYDVRSAGIAIPLAVDQIYTRQVLAS